MNTRNDYDFNHINEVPHLKETIFRQNNIIRINRKYAFKLLNTFPTTKLRNEVASIVRFDEIHVDDWLLNRMVVLADYELDSFEDNQRDNNGFVNPRDRRPINMERNRKLFRLQYVMKVLSVIYSTSYVNLVDKAEQDQVFINTFYNMVMRLKCDEIIDEIVNEIIRRDSLAFKMEVCYDKYLEHRLVDYFTCQGVYNPATVDIYENMLQIINYNQYSINRFTSMVYEVYNVKYNRYKTIVNRRHEINSELSGTNARERFDDLIDGLLLEYYDDYLLNDLLRCLVQDYEGCRNEQYAEMLFDNFKDKYQFVGRVYHGSRDTSGRNKNIDYLVSRYKDGSISSSKDIKQALKFAAYESYDHYNRAPKLHKGFVAEIDITEDMKAIDIDKMLKDLKEKLPNLSSWVSESFLNEKEVLIPAEYIKTAKIMSFEDAEKLSKEMEDK